MNATPHDPVDHPAHYTQGRVECITVTSRLDFCVGNTVKYVWRFRDKDNPVQDLRKAVWYLDYALSHPDVVRRPDGADEQALKWNLAQHEADIDGRSLPAREAAIEKNFWGAIIMNDLPRAKRILTILIRQMEADNRA